MMRHFSCTLLLGGLLTASASARTIHINSEADAPLVSPADVLRSAFYLRASGRDWAAPSTTPHELNGALQRHFDLVLAALVANGDRSLDVALNRLQQARGEFWTDVDRTAWRQTLAQRRALNIRRLRLYQLRGLFPQNEHKTSRAVPIFVDEHNTACAVGHLMRESGWGGAVAAIQRTNNYVCVTDVREGAIVDWVLVSGLIQEEAALIQPSYFPPYRPPQFDNGLDALTQGGSITKNGLRFENFHFVASELAEPDAFPDVPPPANQVNLAGLGAAVREGVEGFIDPAFDDWLFVGARSLDHSIYDRIDPDDPWGVLYSYDVAAVDPGNRLVAASLGSFFTNFNLRPSEGLLDVESWIYPGATAAPQVLAHLAIDTLQGLWFVGEDSASFVPHQQLTVVTAVKLEGPATFTSIAHSFQIVPEPTSAYICCSAVLLGLNQRIRRMVR